MTDAYFDELGIAWRANVPDMNALTMRLRARLRQQTLLIRGVMPLGLLLCVLGLALGVGTISIGWTTEAWNFVTRGVAIITISIMCGFALWSLRNAANDKIKSLAEMIELAIVRAENFLTVARLGLYSCAVAAIFGVGGYEIRTRIGHPSAMGPLKPLAILVLFAAALFFYRRRAQIDLNKFKHLKRILASD